MKVGIFQDVHANLPAMKTAVSFFRSQNCEYIYHVGDLIAIGPYSKEVMELALAIDNMRFIMGNHDYWYAFGLPDPKISGLSLEEREHQKWVREQIGEEHSNLVQQWKFVDHIDFGNGLIVSFLHYGYDPKANWFKTFIKEPDQENMDDLFEGINANMIFYGHNHEASDIQGKCRYINLGSAGCYDRPEVRLGILELEGDQLKLEKFSLPYDDNGLMEEFEKRKVPARDFITKNFISRN